MQRSKKENDKSLPKVVSLFCGAGGLDLGFFKEGFEIPIAVDISEAAIKTHRRNFPLGDAIAADLVKIGPSGVLEEVSKRIPKRHHIGVIGGPPCQGFSRANTRAKADDPRNRLPFLYLNIIRRLKKDFEVDFVILENVPGIRDRKHIGTYESITRGLKALGFVVIEKELCALDFGVPQMRRRVVLLAISRDKSISDIAVRRRPGPKTVREAIGSLSKPVYFKPSLTPDKIPVHPNHWTMKPKSAKFCNPSALRGDTRSFKRLSWNQPSPTIAFGNREIHVHPRGNRRLSIYEAMLLQGFPTSFVLEGNLSQQVEQISNAVPPPLAQSVASAIRRTLYRQPVEEKLQLAQHEISAKESNERRRAEIV